MGICLIAAMDWSPLLWWIDVIVKVAVGLGAVIFVHELGHYLVALACGVKIEKFMIGFDIGGLKLSRRWRDTEYGIGIMPLGGYVKMLGQDDDPAHIAEQMKKSQVDAANTNAVPVTGPNGETYYVDRRSYLAKGVPQRMAIISAGVVMNVIFAFIFAVIAFGMGVPYLPSIVSETVPGSPAWQAGLEPGDEIVQIGQRENPTFMQLKGGVTLGDLEDGIPCLVRRADDGEVVPVTLTPTQEAGKLATIGVGGPQSLTLREGMPTIDHSPAARAKLVSPSPVAEAPGSPAQASRERDAASRERKRPEEAAKLQSGDKIIRVGTQAVQDYRQFAAQLAQNREKPLLITVQRPGKEPVNDPESGAVVQAAESQELTFEVPAQPLKRFPLVMKMGPVTAVQADSPAAAAGLKAGDVIEQVDGKPLVVSDGSPAVDPVTLPEYFRQAALEGREVELVVRLGEGKAAQPETVRLVPIAPTVINSETPLGVPMAADAIGIAYHIENEVRSVMAGSEDVGIVPGDKIIAANIILPADEKGKKPKPVPIELGTENLNWTALVDAVQFAPDGTEVEFTVERDEGAKPHTIRLKPQPADGFFVAKRGFLFEPIIRTRTAATFVEQLRLGWDETAESLTMVFRFLRKLGGQVPITALGGPVTIARAAGYSASEGISSLLIFLTMLSANLAVINFLPIPLLDGGHMVFLAYEGLRGRPASERFVVALHTAGFVFIIGLMLFVLALDVGLVPRNL